MDRVVVVGPSGSGKSTVGRRLAERLGCPYVELDSLWWDANWTEVGPERFRERAAAVVAGDRWVVDGNYLSAGAREVVWPRADTVVWLDPPRWVTVPRVVRRTAVRAVRRTELWSGNRESLRNAVAADSIVVWAWKTHHRTRQRYAALARDSDGTHLDWIRLGTRRAVDHWLASIPSG